MIQVKHLYLTHKKDLRPLLSDFGGAIISISHDRKYIEEVCQTVYELTEEGMLLFTH